MDNTQSQIDHVIAHLRDESVNFGTPYLYKDAEVKLREKLEKNPDTLRDIEEQIGHIKKYYESRDSDPRLAASYLSVLDNSTDGPMQTLESWTDEMRSSSGTTHKAALERHYNTVEELLTQTQPFNSPNGEWWSILKGMHSDIETADTAAYYTIEQMAEFLCEIVKNKNNFKDMQIEGQDAYALLLGHTNDMLELANEIYFIEGTPYSQTHKTPREHREGEPPDEQQPDISYLSAEAANVVFPKLANLAKQYGEPFVSNLQSNILQATQNNKENEGLRIALGQHTSNALPNHKILAELANLDPLRGGSNLERASRVTGKNISSTLPGFSLN